MSKRFDSIINKKLKILKKNCESLYFDIATKGFEEISQNKEKYEKQIMKKFEKVYENDE